MANTYQSTYTGAQHDTYATKSSLINLIYPIGSIYISMNETDPSILFGGTWERISGRFLLGCGGDGPGANNDTNTPQQLSEEQQVWFSDLHPGVTSGEYYHTLTTPEMPTHSHDSYGELPRINDDSVSGNKYGHTTEFSWWFKGVSTSVKPAGQSMAHNNMPPYITVAIWQRIS